MKPARDDSFDALIRTWSFFQACGSTQTKRFVGFIFYQHHLSTSPTPSSLARLYPLGRGYLASSSAILPSKPNAFVYKGKRITAYPQKTLSKRGFLILIQRVLHILGASLACFNPLISQCHEPSARRFHKTVTPCKLLLALPPISAYT